MPTLREMVKKMTEIEDQSDDEPGGYPVFFKNEFYQMGFLFLLRWEKFKRKVKKLCHL